MGLETLATNNTIGLTGPDQTPGQHILYLLKAMSARVDEKERRHRLDLDD